jgi:hypothetical protein
MHSLTRWSGCIDETVAAYTVVYERLPVILSVTPLSVDTRLICSASTHSRKQNRKIQPLHRSAASGDTPKAMRWTRHNRLSYWCFCVCHFRPVSDSNNAVWHHKKVNCGLITHELQQMLNQKKFQLSSVKLSHNVDNVAPYAIDIMF